MKDTNDTNNTNKINDIKSMKDYLIEFNSKDGYVLNGYIHKTEKINKKVLIEIHGMTSNCFKKREKIIANEMEKQNIDTICFNNRGSDIVRRIKDNNGNAKIIGSAFEDVTESYYDIIGSIEFALQQGYEEIYLQGHSLGSTKLLYTYNKMLKENNKYLNNIKAIILLSLVDLRDMFISNISKKHLHIIKQLVKNDKGNTLIPTHNFMEYMSAKTIINYIENDEINLVQYSDENCKYEYLNNIKIPLFMRWGEINEIIKLTAKEQTEMINKKITNPNKDISYIKDANHSYEGKEEMLAKEISKFLINLKSNI